MAKRSGGTPSASLNSLLPGVVTGPGDTTFTRSGGILRFVRRRSTAPWRVPHVQLPHRDRRVHRAERLRGRGDALCDQSGTPLGVAELLRLLRGKTHLVELAQRSGFSRFSIARWLSGTAEPRLPEFLALVEASSFRCLDFLSHFVAPEQLPSIAEDWRALQAARKAACDVPRSHAVLRALELTDYARLPKHRSGWVAARLGISKAEEQRCLGALAAAQQIRMESGRWVIDQTQTVDTRADRARGRKLKQEWLKVALARLQQGVPGTFGYNLMAVSRADLERLRGLHPAYFREMPSLVADSTPSECVVLFNTELFALDAHALAAPKPALTASRASRP